jgi:hypothetical protein
MQQAQDAAVFAGMSHSIFVRLALGRQMPALPFPL